MDYNEIVQFMSKSGMRITEQRKMLAFLFTRESGEEFYSPKEIYEEMEQHYPGLSFDTVYRNLRLMYEMGIIEQFIREDGMRFKLKCDADHHHHHLVCLECDRTYAFEYCPLPELPKMPDQFEIVQHKFEMYGYCKDCKGTRSRS